MNTQAVVFKCPICSTLLTRPLLPLPANQDGTTLYVFIVAFLATLIRSALGFGEALFAVPLLALLLPRRVAAPLAVLLSITIAGIIIAQDWAKIVAYLCECPSARLSYHSGSLMNSFRWQVPRALQFQGLHRKPNSIKRHFGTVSLAFLLSQTLYPCSMIVIGGGGYKVDAVRQLSGTVTGSGRWSLMGQSHDEERRSITVPGATISVKARTDTAFSKRGEVKYPRSMKHSHGNLKEWKCGSEVSAVKTDQAGNFTIIGIQPGKYCLDITGPEPANDEECSAHNPESGACDPLNASFLIDVTPSAPKATLIANISLQWPDCSGGSSLELRAHE